MRRETYLCEAKGTTKVDQFVREATGFVARGRGAPVLRDRRGRIRRADGSRSRRIEGQAPRAGGSSARLGTKKHLLAFDLGLAESRRETPNIGFDIQRLLLERS